MSDHIPNHWSMVETSKGHHKIFGSWSGGYLDGDSWKLNSGIERVIYDPVTYTYYVYGFSGSIYRVTPSNYGASGYNTMVLNNLIENSNGKMKLLTEQEALVILTKYTEE